MEAIITFQVAEKKKTIKKNMKKVCVNFLKTQPRLYHFIFTTTTT